MKATRRVFLHGAAVAAAPFVFGRRASAAPAGGKGRLVFVAGTTHYHPEHFAVAPVYLKDVALATTLPNEA